MADYKLPTASIKRVLLCHPERSEGSTVRC